MEQKHTFMFLCFYVVSICSTLCNTSFYTPWITSLNLFLICSTLSKTHLYASCITSLNLFRNFTFEVHDVIIQLWVCSSSLLIMTLIEILPLCLSPLSVYMNLKTSKHVSIFDVHPTSNINLG